MDYKKPQDTLVHGGIGLYPLTTADQVILADGGRLEKAGKINADKLGGRTLAEIMLALYPVGAVYISVNSTSPASLFGGEWTQINGRFLIGTGAPENNDDGTSPGNYDKTLGSKGGEANHTLTVNEMPSHVHESIQANGDIYYKILYGQGGSITTNAGTVNYTTGSGGFELKTSPSGGSQRHNNMPPYLAVYMWKRVN